MFKTILTRLTNPKVVLSVVSGILIILVNFNFIDIDMSAKLEDTVNIILGIGVTVGIFSDPESHVDNQ